MLLKDLISKGTETISVSYPEREAREMVFACLEHILGTRRHTHIVEPGFEVPADKADDALSAFARMASGEPLQYVTGVAFFYGRSFRVTPDVLVPRPETELLCRLASDALRGRKVDGPAKVLDLCTGSGCIAWTLALECPGAVTVAVDLSDGALAIAGSQCFDDEIARTGAVPPVFLKGDVLEPSHLVGTVLSPDGGLPDSYDLILSNPPYVMEREKADMRPNVLEHEPSMALFVPDSDPLVFYRAVAGTASSLLSRKGICIVEINEALGEETAGVFRSAGFGNVRVEKDFTGRDRFVMAEFV